MGGQLISLIEIADAHGKRRQSVHKLVNRLGMKTTKRKNSQAHGQAVSYIAATDYEELKRHFNGQVGRNDETVSDISSVFYIIQLEPDLDQGRIKVGFTTDIGERMRSHRTSAPFSTIVRTWPCKLLWEKTAIECITRDCEQLHTEIFRTDNIDAVVDRANRFFGLMPPTANSSDQNELDNQNVAIGEIIMKEHLSALYARVSSDRQDVDLSVAAQLRALRDYAEKNG